MNEAWLLLVLLFPPTDGLIMGWQKEHSSLADCEMAKIRVVTKARRSPGTSRTTAVCVRKE